MGSSRVRTHDTEWRVLHTVVKKSARICLSVKSGPKQLQDVRLVPRWGADNKDRHARNIVGFPKSMAQKRRCVTHTGVSVPSNIHKTGCASFRMLRLSWKVRRDKNSTRYDWSRAGCVGGCHRTCCARGKGAYLREGTGVGCYDFARV